MKFKELTISYGRKVQLQQFEPADYRETITVELEDGDDPEEVSRELADLVEEHVEREILSRVLAHKMADDRDEDDE